MCHINNIKISFHRPQSNQGTDQKDSKAITYASITEQPLNQDINQYQLRPASNILKYGQIYRQYYQCIHEMLVRVNSSSSKQAVYHPYF